MVDKQRRNLKPAMLFILMMGIVSLFSDMTHEGARSIYGAYLSFLGASAATIGFVTGLGELFGYSFRLLAGFITDIQPEHLLSPVIQPDQKPHHRL